MHTTARVVCTSKAAVPYDETQYDEPEQYALTFAADYNDGRNAEWAKYTPALSLSMSVRADVAEQFTQGQALELVFQTTELEPDEPEIPASGLETVELPGPEDADD